MTKRAKRKPAVWRGWAVVGKDTRHLVMWRADGVPIIHRDKRQAQADVEWPELHDVVRIEVREVPRKRRA